MTRQIFLLVFIFSVFPSTALSAPSSFYYISNISVTDLGTLGGAESEARDINNAGEIVGWADRYNSNGRAFLYRDGDMQDISISFFGLPSVANGINRYTHVVGHLTISGQPRGFYWSNGTAQILKDKWVGFPSDVKSSYGSANAISDTGRIVGYAYGAGTPPFAMYWAWPTATPKKIIDNPGAQMNSWAFDINNNQQIVGYDLSFTVVGNAGYVYQWGGFTQIPRPVATGGLSYSDNHAYGINDKGYVTGEYYIYDPVNGQYSHAYLWNGSSSHSYDLGSLGTGLDSIGRDVNEQAFVAGEAAFKPLFGSNRSAAFLWHSDFGMKRLPAPAGAGSVLLPSQCKANALNDRKSSGLIQVVGYCTVAGNRHAMRWDVSVKVYTPVYPSPRLAPQDLKINWD